MQALFLKKERVGSICHSGSLAYHRLPELIQLLLLPQVMVLESEVVAAGLLSSTAYQYTSYQLDNDGQAAL